MTPVEYIGTKDCQVGRGIARGLVWNGPNDVIPIADDIAEKITTWHPDTYRLSTGGRSEPGAPVEPGKAEGPADQRLVSTYKILAAGKMVPAERAGYMTLRAHMMTELGLELPDKAKKVELLTILEGVLKAREHANETSPKE